MTEMQPESGQNERKARVKFGPKPWQTLPHERAELLLMKLRERSRKQFGDALLAVLDDDQ